MDSYDLRQAALAVAAASTIYALYRRYSQPSLKDIPGPPNPSWVHGHEWYWQIQDASVVEKHILENYGTVARCSGVFGEDRLWIADPKAINHIFKNSSALYRKLDSTRAMTELIIDRGLAWAEGEAHRRQRRAMTPAFGLVEAKGLLPYFAQSATKLADRWHELIASKDSGESSIIDISSWFCKATLDAIGTGAFEYDFGALDDSDNRLMRTYSNMLFPSNAPIHQPKERIFVRNAIRDKGPVSVNLQQNKEEAHRVARTLIDLKKEELSAGASRKDLLSLLVKSSSALRPDWRLNDEEIVAQIRTIMFAGHETTARALTLALWELAKNRDVQERLRTEVNEAWEEVKARGDSEFSANDLDNMDYLVAVGKETLRVHPPVIEVARIACDDDVIPLSKPVVGVSGKAYHEIPISKGTRVVISTFGHNLNPEVWGADSYEWCPERWLEKTGNSESPVGVYANLATFSGGVRSCIGWRFAVYEMQLFLATLIKQFEFDLPDNAPKIRRWRPGFTVTVVEGEEHNGIQLPLKVTQIRNK